ncbi:phosphatase PAP2 family protein [Holzapfeliella sp. He02]|uniref:Phosphatase PAP2 family protein n=1 Tax=Holzapfeliella saturejae TaxID=3082953 RepID=A0ABU8SH20_9LACO
MIFNPKLFKNRWFYLGTASLISFIIWLALVTNHTTIITQTDCLFTHLLQNNFTMHYQKLAISITLLGNPLPMIFLSAITFGFLVYRKKYQLGLLMAGSGLIILFSNLILKSWIARPRPDTLHLVNASGFSFPSGHAMNSLFLFGVFYLIYKPYIPQKFQSLFKFFCICIPLLIGFSRVTVGVHYPSDVIGGFLLAIVGITLFYIFITNKKTLS